MRIVPMDDEAVKRGIVAMLLEDGGPLLHLTPGQKRAILEGIRPPSDGDPRR